MANANNVLIYYNGVPTAGLRQLMNKLAGEGYRAQYRAPNLFGSAETCAKAVVVGGNETIEKAYAKLNIPCEVVQLDDIDGGAKPAIATEAAADVGPAVAKEAETAKDDGAQESNMTPEDKPKLRKEKNLDPPTKALDPDAPRPPPAASGR